MVYVGPIHIFNLFWAYKPITSLLLRMKCVFEHQYLQMFGP